MSMTPSRGATVTALTVAALLAAAATPASAGILNLVAMLDGAQEAPNPVNTPGTGLGTVTYETQTNLLSWNVTFGNLLGTTSNAHFHGPAPRGVPAGVAVGIASISGLNSPMIGSTTLTAAQESQLLSELWYINVHSSAYPGGEIRGQVEFVPEPSTWTMGLVVLAVAALRARRLV